MASFEEMWLRKKSVVGIFHGYKEVGNVTYTGVRTWIA